MYQDEAGFGRISKLGSCWSPIGVGPHVHSHYIREFRYCYGAVDAHTGESFFLIAGGCNTEWMNAFLEELSQAYPDDYLLLVMDNAIWHKSSTLKIPTNIGMSRKGNSQDNGMMESFFGILKSEMFYGYEKTFKSLNQLEQAIIDYIDYYNNKKIKIKLKGLSPVQYRTKSFG
ncbi:degenerate transposase [Streptococcus pneumoniae]|nr:degenerate transposase [Streptococcus pneumoniae]